MGMIAGNGRPTRETRGSIGDLYKDLKSGSIYECTMAYRASTFEPYVYEWTQLSEDDLSNRNIVFQNEPINKPKVIPETIEKSPKSNKSNKSKYTDYTVHNKK